MNKKQIIGLIVAVVLFTMTGVASVVVNSWADRNKKDAKSSLMDVIDVIEGKDNVNIDLPFDDYMAVVRVDGTIADEAQSGSVISSGSSYSHSFTMNYIEQVKQDANNKGLLLIVDSPGGSVYTSDELYLKLMDYKKTTGRPIYCYFESYACSGGYYISMAADEIYANRNTWTGSIGVISTLYDLTGLYEKLGVKEINITSGRNKAMGSTGQTLTDEQYAIMQSLIDEAYEQFVSIVAEGRTMTVEQVKEIADGRVVSASQARDSGLIDGICGLGEYKDAISQTVGTNVIYFEPEIESGILESLFSRIESLVPKSDTELMTEYAHKLKGGIWYYAQQLR